MSCVANAVSFSGLSILNCPSIFLNVYFQSFLLQYVVVFVFLDGSESVLVFNVLHISPLPLEIKLSRVRRLGSH